MAKNLHLLMGWGHDKMATIDVEYAVPTIYLWYHPGMSVAGSRALRRMVGLNRRSGRRRRGMLALLALAVILLIPWVLNVSRPGTRVEGCPQGCATAGPRRDGPLRVMSLNVLHGFPRFENLDQRLNLVATVIQETDADVVLLQEIPWHMGSSARQLAKETGRNHVYLRANGNRWALLFEEGEVILSRYPLRDAAFTELEPRAGPFEHRVVLGATADTPWGPVRLFSTHLTHGEPGVNAGQAASLADFVARYGKGPALVGGDFNAEEHEAQIRTLSWVDTYRLTNPDDPGFTCCVQDLTPNTVEAGQAAGLDRRIDYLFLVPAGRAAVVSSRRVLDQPLQTSAGWLWASDHVALLSEIDLGPVLEE
jgi:endonuclease/exonuclease/phosphatase family metal-dependent hydrolase